LEALSTHDAADAKEAENIVERVIPRLSHNNPAVILAAVKLILKNLDEINKDQKKAVSKKLAAPLITLLSCEPEIQYIALRNINFVL
jgi:AP-1 complex subunit beta-1